MEPAALSRLRENLLLGVIRAPDAESALAAANAVVKGGVSVIEISFTVPDAARVMADLVNRGEALVGAGTVLRPEQLRDALVAGAQFIVAPNYSPEIGAVAMSAGVLYCPGAYTASEVITARRGGAPLIKLFPVGAVGGPNYVQALRDPLPDVEFLAAGGTTLENMIPLLRAGCVAIGLGSALCEPKLVAARQFDELTRRAKAFVQRISEARASGFLAPAAVARTP